MKVEKKSKYTLITSDENTFSAFLTNFENGYKNVLDDHLILFFSEEINTSIKDLLLLLDRSSAHKMRNLSFICVTNGVEIDEITEELSIVPTLEEAEDLLEMDAIERDLGF